MSEQLISQALSPYIEQLKIDWPLDYAEREFVSIESNPRTKRHTIFYNDRAKSPKALREFRRENPILANLIHEFCHAYLCERIDPLFASKNYSHNISVQSQILTQTDQLINYVTNIWVDDAFYERWPRIFEEHNRTYTRQAVNFANHGVWGALGLPGVPLGIVQSRAESKRHKFQHVSTSPVLTYMKTVLPSIYAKIKSLEELWASLPAINYETGIEIYEGAVAKSANILEIPVRVQIIKEDGLHAWELTPA